MSKDNVRTPNQDVKNGNHNENILTIWKVEETIYDVEEKAWKPSKLNKNREPKIFKN